MKIVLVGNLFIPHRTGQILLDNAELKLLTVLRHEKPQKLVSNFWGSVHSGGFLLPGGSEQGGALRVRFEGLGLPAQPAPNPPFAAAERQPRAPQARVRGSNQLFDWSQLPQHPTHQFVYE